MKRKLSLVILIIVISACILVISLMTIRLNVEIALNPDWSPTNNQIAFECFRPTIFAVIRSWFLPSYHGDIPYNPKWSEICIYDEDNTPVIKITNNNSADNSPRFSPNGNEIAYISTRENTKELHIYSLSNQNSFYTTTIDGLDDISWNPSSTSLAFARVSAVFNQPNDNGIFIYNLETKQTEIVIRGNNRFPTWSNNGKYLSYVSDKSDNGGVCYLHVIDIENGSEVTGSIESYCYAKPSWSPSDEKLVFIGPTNENVENALHLLELDLDRSYQISPFAWGIDNPTWNSDGNSIYYIVQGGINRLKHEDLSEVTIIEAGDKPIRVFIASQNLDVSPDETKLCFVRSSKNENSQIWLAGVNGSDQHIIYP